MLTKKVIAIFLSSEVYLFTSLPLLSEVYFSQFFLFFLRIASLHIANLHITILTFFSLRILNSQFCFCHRIFFFLKLIANLSLNYDFFYLRIAGLSHNLNFFQNCDFKTELQF